MQIQDHKGEKRQKETISKRGSHFYAYPIIKKHMQISILPGNIHTKVVLRQATISQQEMHSEIIAIQAYEISKEKFWSDDYKKNCSK